MTPDTDTNIHPRVIEDEMRVSYLSYSMSVIVGRALPDVRDGLKPVHRRVLYAMYDMGMLHNKPFKKSARIVGEVLGKYHPHGDSAVYDTMVRLVQDFSMRKPLIDGQGNFGCFTKDTKVRLADGRSLTFGQLIEEDKAGKRNFIFTIDANNHVQIAEIKNPRLTKKNALLVEVTLDSGARIRCTPDHRFMLLDGTYVEAQHLSQGLSLTSNDTNLLYAELCHNHKVVRVEHLSDTADVYDLTVDTTHNFLLDAGVFVHNSVDGDSAAAMRYTEARLNALAEELLADIDKQTVDFVPNFDGSLKEPSVLPSKVPELLVNGSAGIAVGMATNIPPHNLNEVCKGVIAAIDNPTITSDQLMDYIPAPDFPTGGSIIGTSGIREAYRSGRGKLVIRANITLEENKNRQRLIVNEIPYQVNKSVLVEEIADLVRDKKIVGISDLRDESDRDGMRIVIELKQGSNPEVVQNQLYAHTKLQTTFGIIMLALVDKSPRVLSLRELVEQYILHRHQVVRRRTQFNLTDAEKKAHILEGLIIALDNIDECIALIKRSKSAEIAREGLVKSYSLTETQAQAILDMKLQRLTSLEQNKIREEHKNLLVLIEELKAILADEKRILSIIKEELTYIAEKYGDKRRSHIETTEAATIEDEELIKPEDNVVTITHAGYVKRLPIDTYKQQNRGGKGIIATGTKEEDFVEDLFIANTRSSILFFTNKGKVHWIKVYQLPEASRQARGSAIVNLLALEEGEKVNAFIPVKSFDDAAFNESHFLLMCTKDGIVKKCALSNFANPRRGGIIAIELSEADELIGVLLTDGKKQVIIATENGMAIRFDEKDVRAMGRTAAGVIGIRLREDHCVSMVEANEARQLLTITEKGYGKRTSVVEYRLTSRGGVGIINLNITDKNGKVVAVKDVSEKDELMLISQNGIIIRIPVEQISLIGRNTQGVRVMKVEDGDRVVSAAHIAENGN